MSSEEPPEITVAVDKDLDGLFDLDKQVLGDSGRREFLAEAVEERRCYLTKIRDTLAGFVVIEQSFYGHAFVSLLVVHPDYRRRGTASALIRHVESNCPTEKLFTSTNHSNTAMQHALEKLGFTRSGHIENLDEGDPEIVYFKHAGPAWRRPAL